MWDRYAQNLLLDPNTDCYLFPSVDLWGSPLTIRADKPIGVKFRMHKGGLKRGVWRAAWAADGKHFDTSRSDSCELLDSNGDLARSIPVVPSYCLQPTCTDLLRDFPYTLHFGYVDFTRRVKVNKAIWADHWVLRSGHEESVATEVGQLIKEPVIKHALFDAS